MQIQIAPAQQTALLNQLPDAAHGPTVGFDYDGETFTIPDVWVAAAQAIMAKPGWDAGAATEQLVAYANTKQWALATGGLTLTLSGQTIKFATDDDSRTAIAGKYLRMAQPGAPTTIAWQVGPRSFVTLSAADFGTMAVKVADFVQATFDALAVVLAAIAAGTVTTEAQVDGAAWPATTG